MIGGAISHTSSEAGIIQDMPVSQELLQSRLLSPRWSPTSVVRGEAVARGTQGPPRSVAEYRNGLSVVETRIASAALTFMSRHSPLIWLPLEAHAAGEVELRRLSDRLKSDVGQMQRRAGGPRWTLEILEGTYAVHTNIVAPTPLGLAADDVIARLLASQTYGAGLQGGAQPVSDLRGLRNYLLKESTPQAWVAAGRSFRRELGSHRLGEGGGDRLRLSRELENDMLEARLIEPRRRTYACRRLTSEKRRSAKLTNPKFNVIEGGQIALFPVRPPCRLRDFAHGIMPRAVALEVEFHRKRLGLSQSQLAARVGIKQPQLSNVLRGHDRMAAWVVTRLRDVLLSGDSYPVALAA